MTSMLEEYRKEINREIGDLDARLIGLKNRFASIDDHVDTRVNTVRFYCLFSWIVLYSYIVI